MRGNKSITTAINIDYDASPRSTFVSPTDGFIVRQGSNDTGEAIRTDIGMRTHPMHRSVTALNKSEGNTLSSLRSPKYSPQPTGGLPEPEVLNLASPRGSISGPSGGGYNGGSKHTNMFNSTSSPGLRQGALQPTYNAASNSIGSNPYHSPTFSPQLPPVPQPKRRKGCSFRVLILIVGLLFISINVFIISQYMLINGKEYIKPPIKDSGEGPKAVNEPGDNPEGPKGEQKGEAPPLTVGDGQDFKRQESDTKRLEPLTYDLEAWNGYKSMDDILEHKVSTKHWGPSDLDAVPYREHEIFARVTGCDLLTVPFDPSKDKQCIQYMLDRDNWKELRPLPMEFDQRTIKFEIEFKPVAGTTTMLSTLIKVPQKLFPFEAFSEVAAFEADRIMNINRVPPTTVLWLPIDDVKSALQLHGSKMSAVEEFLKESEVNTFSEWVEKDFINYTHKMKWQQMDEATNKVSAPISMQLRIADCGHLLDTALAIPYKTHNTSWHRYFDLIKQRDEKGRPIFMKEKFIGTIVHISEVATFDMIIGNDDRSPNKNNFVVGACTEHGGCADVPVHNQLKHPGPPTFVHLDQGMAFYGTPKRSALHVSLRDEDADPSFCVFRTGLLNRLRELGALFTDEEPAIDDGRIGVNGNVDDKRLKTLFHKLMSERLPPIVKNYVDSHTLRSCSKRLLKILNLYRRCSEHAEIAPYILAP